VPVSALPAETSQSRGQAILNQTCIFGTHGFPAPSAAPLPPKVRPHGLLRAGTVAYYID